jgi:exopolysaccharide biosynthesis polyprenyl glycosylphosphotransferase
MAGTDDGGGMANDPRAVMEPTDDPIAQEAPAPLGPGQLDNQGSGPAAHRFESVGRPSLRRHLVLTDAAAVTAAWLPLAVVGSSGEVTKALVCAVAAAAATLVAMQRAELYRSHVCTLPSREAVRTVMCALIGVAAFAVCGFLAGLPGSSLPLWGGVVAAALLLAVRWRFSRWLKGRRSGGLYLRTALLLGTSDDAVALSEMLAAEPELGYVIVGVVGTERRDAPWEGLPHRTHVDEVVALARATGAVGIIIVAGALPGDATAVAIRAALAAGLHVQVWPGLLGLSSRRIQFAPVCGLPVFYVAPKAIATWQLGLKRTMDIAISVVLLPFVAPVLIVAAICIKLEDRGPLLHHHAVIGRHGVPTTVLKLRTMVPNASQMMADVAAMNERRGGPLFKATNDPRVTKVGRILRATSIDELPQLWNVLTGRMSLVGPRFALPHEVAHFDADLRRRHEMRPGITGLWQTEARDNPSFSAYRRLDLLYVDNWSFTLDLAILGNTAHAVIVRALRTILPSPGRRRDGSGRPTLSVPSLTVEALTQIEPVSPE